MTHSNYDDVNEVAVVLQELPGNIHAYSQPNGDTYTVILNSALSDDAQRRAYEHELEHIRRGDHHNLEYVEYPPLPAEQQDPPPVDPQEQRLIAWLTMREQAMLRGEERYGISPFHPIWEKLWEYWSFGDTEDAHLMVDKEIDGYSWHFFCRMAAYIFKPWRKKK